MKIIIQLRNIFLDFIDPYYFKAILSRKYFALYFGIFQAYSSCFTESALYILKIPSLHNPLLMLYDLKKKEKKKGNLWF